MGLGFSKADLEQLKHLSPGMAAELVSKLPVSLLVKLYATRCSKQQVAELFREWLTSVDERAENKIVCLVKALRRARKEHFIPGFIKERFK